MITISKNDQLVQAIYDQLLSDVVDFTTGTYDFFDRLDAMSQLTDLADADPNLVDEGFALMICGFEKIKELSVQLKEMILAVPPTSNNQRELGLLHKLLHQEIDFPALKEFKYVVAYEWWASHFNSKTQLTETHQGDLVLMNDVYSFLVVELKYIHKVKSLRSAIERQRRTQKVCQQARKFSNFFGSRYPWADVDCLALTNVSIFHGRRDKVKISL